MNYDIMLGIDNAIQMWLIGTNSLFVRIVYSRTSAIQTKRIFVSIDHI